MPSFPLIVFLCLAPLAAEPSEDAGQTQTAPQPNPPVTVAASEPPVRAIVSGQVRSKGTRLRVSLATIQVDQGGVIQDDGGGAFELQLSEGRHQLTVSAPGFRSASFTESVAAGELLRLVYSLEPLEVNPYSTVVIGARDRTEVSRVSLREQEIHDVPGTMGDPFRAVMSMPGVSSLASGLSYPVVRGTQPAATGFFIDGVQVPMLYHVLLGPAVVQPEFLDGIDFFPGLPPARYGGLLGGAIEGRVSRSRDDRLHVSGYSDALSSAAMVEVPFQESQTNVTLAGRMSYSAPLLALGANLANQGQPANEKYSANFWDYQGRVEQRLGKLQLRLLALGSSDVLGWDSDDARSSQPAQFIRLKEEFHRLDLRGRYPLAGGTLELGGTWGTETLGGNMELSGSGEYWLWQSNLIGRAGFSRIFSDSLELELGATVERRQDGVRASGVLQSPLQAQMSGPDGPSSLGTVAGAFAQLAWKPASTLSVIPGIRLDSYHLVPGLTHTAFDPRIALRWACSEELTLKAGAGQLNQLPTTLIPVPSGDLASLGLGLQETIQTSLGAEWRTSWGFELTGEAFVDPMLRTIESSLKDSLANRFRPATQAVDPSSHGYAYGLELMLRRPLGGRWFGWLSYTYTQSRRWARFARTDQTGQEIGMQEAYLPFAFEQAHVASAAASYRLPGNYTVGAAISFHSGRPESGELSSRSMRAVDDPALGPVWRTVDRDQVDRLPAYLRLDVRASKSWALDQLTLEAYLDLFNAAFQQEVYGYSYSEGGRGAPGLEKQPLALPVFMPVLGVKGAY